MTDLLTVVPDFDVASFTHVLPSLEKARICTADLITLEAPDVARRAQVPLGEVQKLAVALLAALHESSAIAKSLSSETSGKLIGQVGTSDSSQQCEGWTAISTLDDSLDAALGGGFSSGHLSEVVGESAVGKTQLLLTLLLSVQLSPPSEKPKSALYISTEAPLQTSRLTQILNSHPKLADLPSKERPSLSRIQSTHIHDLEAQEHILRYQVPVAIQKLNVGLVVVDSIAANYRAEYDKGGVGRKTADSLAKRNTQLAKSGALLRQLAQANNIAVVVANQVADRFSTLEPVFLTSTQLTQGFRPDSPARAVGQAPAPILWQNTPQLTSFSMSTGDPLSLDHQQRFFTGWGNDIAVTNLKTPSLGLTWTNQLATRIALLKEPIYDQTSMAPGEERSLVGWKRTCTVVFSAWCAESKTAFEIWGGGVRSLAAPPDPEKTF